MCSSSSEVITISDGGKTITFSVFFDDSIYNFQFAKSDTIAYYTESCNLKDIWTSFPDKTYYSYIAFGAKGDELLKYEYIENFIEESLKKSFEDFEIDADGGAIWSKPKRDINLIDFSHMFFGKDDIDFDNAPGDLGTIQ